jgi:hypothetical protein
MARVKFNPSIDVHETVKKKTSIGCGRISKSMMNKSKKRSYKKYRGQGK